MDTELTTEDLAECQSALAYVDDMSEWYEDDGEGATRLDFALRILEQIDRRGHLSRLQHAWCDARIRERYAA